MTHTLFLFPLFFFFVILQVLNLSFIVFEVHYYFKEKIKVIASKMFCKQNEIINDFNNALLKEFLINKFN